VQPRSSLPAFRRLTEAAPRLSAKSFLRISQAVMILVVLNIGSGAAVRVTGSGLGCPDWPTCTQRALTPAMSFHPLMEFSNRMVVILLVVVIAVCALASLVRAGRWRRDLVWLAWSLVGGVLAEAVIGGVVVLTKLNPFAVMGHLMVSMALLAVATVLVLRASGPPGPSVAKVALRERRLAWAMLGLLVLVLVAGTATTGAAPDGGSPQAVRLPVPLDDMARTHSLIVMALGVVLLYTLYRLYQVHAPESIQHRGRVVLGIVIVQGIIGYTQFFTHLPAALVEMHDLGASCVVMSLVWFTDGLYHRAGSAEDEPTVIGPTAAEEGVVPLPEPVR